MVSPLGAFTKDFLKETAEANLEVTAAVVGRFNPLAVPIVDFALSLIVVGVLRLFSSFLAPLAVIGVVFKLVLGVFKAEPFLSAPFFYAKAVEGLLIPNTFFVLGVLGADTWFFKASCKSFFNLSISSYIVATFSLTWASTISFI